MEVIPIHRTVLPLLSEEGKEHTKAALEFFINAVEAPLGDFAARYNARITQAFEMLGRVGLGDTQCKAKLAFAQLPLTQ